MELNRFAERWQLDGDAQNFLRSLEPQVQEVVLRDFAPHEGTHDVAGKLHAFVKGIRRGVTLEAFIQKWNLDASTAAWIREMPEAVSEALVRDFDPKEDTQNLVGKLKGFARSILSRHAGGAGAPAAAAAASAPAFAGNRRRLLDFVSRWGVEESLAYLQSLPTPVQTKVIEQFDPKGDTMNVNGRLCSFARSVAGGREHHAEAPLGAFASRWQLNERSRQVLAALPQEVLNTVMAEFRPAPGTASVDGKLQTFARGVLERFQEPQAAGGSRAVADFVARWGLDAEAGAFLESLPEGPLSTVLSEFSPRAGTRNVVGKLRAFAGTVLEAQGFGGLSHESLGLGGGLGLPGGLGLGLGGLGGLTALGLSLGGLRGQLGLGDHAFLQKWGLADNELAKEALQVLTPEVKARLVRDFQPAPGTVDVAGKFLSFAQSVARGRPVRQVQPSSLAPMRPGSLGVGAAGAVGPVGPVGPGPAELEAFVQRWALDGEAVHLLQSLAQHLQQRVLLEFNPHGDTRDTSGKFCAFARSLLAPRKRSSDFADAGNAVIRRRL